MLVCGSNLFPLFKTTSQQESDTPYIDFVGTTMNYWFTDGSALNSRTVIGMFEMLASSGMLMSIGYRTTSSSGDYEQVYRRYTSAVKQNVQTQDDLYNG